MPSGGEQDVLNVPNCPGCGTTKHNDQPRDKKCPAWGKKCGGCGRLNHFLRVCQQGQNSTDIKPKDDQPSYGAAAAWEEFDQDNTSWFLAFGIEIEHLISSDNRSLPHVEWAGWREIRQSETCALAVHTCQDNTTVEVPRKVSASETSNRFHTCDSRCFHRHMCSDMHRRVSVATKNFEYCY